MGNKYLSEINFDFEKFISELSSDSPTPGGGSVAALSGALGSALTAMVARLTIKKTDIEPEFKKELEEIVAKADNATTRFMKFVVEDAAAYENVLQAFKMPKNTDEEKEARSIAIQEAFKHAAEVPMYVVELANEILLLTRILVDKGSESAISDSAVAVSMLGSAIRGGRLNVEINLKYVKDESFTDTHSDRLAEIKNNVDRITGESTEIIKNKFD